MQNKVVVTGMGIISSAGLSPEECWDNLLNRKASTTSDERLKDAEVKICCPIHNWIATEHLKKSLIWRCDLFIQYALYAAQQALSNANITITEKNKRIGIVLGNSLAGITTIERLKDRTTSEGLGALSSSYILSAMGNMATGNMAIELGITGPTYLIGTACASGTDAIGLGKQLIEQGLCDMVLAGASEAPITPLIVSSFAKIKALSRNSDITKASRPFDKNRDGFVISEGVAILVLESETHALARDADILAIIAGYGSSNDSYHITSPSPEGRGLQDSILGALDDAKLAPEDINCINAHGTGTSLNDKIEGAVISKIFGCDTPVTSTKGVTGHSLAASGAMETIFSVLKIKYNKIPPVAGLEHQDEGISINVTHNVIEKNNIDIVLTNSLGFGGQNATLILKRYD